MKRKTPLQWLQWITCIQNRRSRLHPGTYLTQDWMYEFASVGCPETDAQTSPSLLTCVPGQLDIKILQDLCAPHLYFLSHSASTVLKPLCNKLGNLGLPQYFCTCCPICRNFFYTTYSFHNTGVVFEYEMSPIGSHDWTHSPAAATLWEGHGEPPWKKWVTVGRLLGSTAIGQPHFLFILL